MSCRGMGSGVRWGLFLGVVMVWLLSAGSGVGAGEGFGDVGGGVHAPAIGALDAGGVLDGTGCGEGLFCPGEPIMRWVMAVWLVRVIDGREPSVVRSSRFADVGAGEWWAGHVERLAELGVTAGCARGPARFCPQEPVTRAQMASFLVRALGLSGGPWTGFVDIADNTHVANISALAAARVTAGCSVTPLRYCPGESVTRAQMATFLARGLGLVDLPVPLTTSLTVYVSSEAPEPVNGSFEIAVSFSEPVWGFSRDDIAVVNGRVRTLSGSGADYRAVVEPAEFGTVMVRIPSEVLKRDDGAGNWPSVPLTRTFGSDSHSDGPGFDTWDRAAVLRAYHHEFNRKEPDPKFTGDVKECIAGTTSQAYRNSVIQRINWYRQMAGVPTVVENRELSAGAQKKALMMAAEGRLSHSPGLGWACYTELHERVWSHVGENLAASSGVSAIDDQMQDHGPDNIINASAGHRSHILSPWVLEFGTGDVPGRSNALWSGHKEATDTRVREELAFIAWPPPGYVPAGTVWGRWSFSGAGDARGASVEVSDDSGPVEAHIISRGTGGFVWAVHGDTSSRRLPTPTPVDRCYTVTISDVYRNGVIQPPYQYATCLMAPPVAPSRQVAGWLTERS